MRFQFTIPGRPMSVNHLYVNLGPGKRFTSKPGITFKARVKLLAMEAMHREGCGLMLGNAAIAVRFYFETKRGDIDNCIKAIMDSMTGVVWDDDGQVTKLYAEKEKDKDNPRTVVEVYEESEWHIKKIVANSSTAAGGTAT